MPSFPLRLLLIVLLLSPLPARTADQVGAAAVARGFDSTVRFEDGEVAERRIHRAGIEYWEGVGGGVFLGFAVGYAEEEARSSARPFALASGNYGALGLRFETPLADNLYLRGRASYLLQRGDHGTEDIELETRLYETRAELGPLLRLRRLELSAGASWRRLDYRETITDTAGELARYADGHDSTGAFAMFGWRTDNSGSIALRYDAGAEDGWTLSFERTYR